MSYYDRAESTSKPGRRIAEEWSTKPLSGKQKAQLSVAARTAFEIHLKSGLAEPDFDAWRHQQIEVACGRSGLRAATQKHYRSILAHFQSLAGLQDAAKQTWARTGRVAGSEEIHDTHENRETARAILRDLIVASQGAIGDNYVAAISRSKFAGRDIYNLSAFELQTLVMTVRARLSRKRKPDAGSQS